MPQTHIREQRRVVSGRQSNRLREGQGSVHGNEKGGEGETEECAGESTASQRNERSGQ